MIFNNKTKKMITILWLLFIPLSLFAAIFMICGLDMRKGDQWDQFYTIVSSDGEAIEDFLEEEDLSSFLSLNKSVIIYNDISSLRTTSLNDVQSRFDVSDPRLDLYMERAKELFFTQSDQSEYNLVYLENSSISIFSLYWKLSKRFSSDEIFWFISGFDPVRMVMPLCLFILYMFLFTFLSKDKLVILAGFSGWIPFVFLYGIPALISVIALSYLIYRNRSPILVAIVIVLSLFFLNITCGISTSFSLTFLQGLLINFYLYSAGHSRPEKSRKTRKITFRKPDHEIFSPVTIGIGTQKHVNAVENRRNLFPVAASFLFIVIISMLFEKKEDTFIFPVLEEQSDLQWTLSDTGLTGGAHLSPADYVTHYAFQEGFLFSREWVYPHIEKPILYPVFQTEEKSISKSYRTQFDYSEEWFSELVAHMKYDNPAKLLFSTKSPGYIIKKINHYNYQSFLLLKKSFCMLFLFLLFFSDGKKYKNLSFSVKSKLLRRNEQVA